MKYPHITFHLNKSLDIKMAKYFLEPNNTRAGFDFTKEILKLHPQMEKFLNMNKSEKDNTIQQYCEQFYQSNTKEIEKSKDEFQSQWDKVETDFFKICDNVFEKLLWPKGQYFGYISILPIGPRFLKDKTFQTCWLWQKNLKSQVIHELLHFQFYNLADKLHPQTGFNDQFTWELSEIFNDIVQNEKKFIKLQGYAPKPGYPNHITHLSKYRQIWNKNKTAKAFILNSII